MGGYLSETKFIAHHAYPLGKSEMPSAVLGASQPAVSTGPTIRLGFPKLKRAPEVHQHPQAAAGCLESVGPRLGDHSAPPCPSGLVPKIRSHLLSRLLVKNLKPLALLIRLLLKIHMLHCKILIDWITGFCPRLYSVIHVHAHA